MRGFKEALDGEVSGSVSPGVSVGLRPWDFAEGIAHWLGHRFLDILRSLRTRMDLGDPSSQFAGSWVCCSKGPRRSPFLQGGSLPDAVEVATLCRPYTTLM